MLIVSKQSLVYTSSSWGALWSFIWSYTSLGPHFVWLSYSVKLQAAIPQTNQSDRFDRELHQLKKNMNNFSIAVYMKSPFQAQACPFEKTK